MNDTINKQIPIIGSPPYAYICRADTLDDGTPAPTCEDLAAASGVAPSRAPIIVADTFAAVLMATINAIDKG